MFESQTKIKLGSLTMAPVPPQVDAEHPMPPSINKYVGDFIKQEVDNYLHKNPDTAEVMMQKIQESEKERKAMAGVTKLARERAKKANLHNRKLRDCRIHSSDVKECRNDRKGRAKRRCRVGHWGNRRLLFLRTGRCRGIDCHLYH